MELQRLHRGQATSEAAGGARCIGREGHGGRARAGNRAPRAPARRPGRARRLAAGRGDVQIADILPEAPPGLAIVESDPEDIAPVVEPLRQKLEPVLRSIETRAVVPEDSLMGTGVVLVNYSKQNGDPEDVVTASLTAAHETPGMRAEELSVAGTRAALLEPEDAAMQITWPVGDCALGILYDDDRERILSVAEALRAPPAP